MAKQPDTNFPINLRDVPMEEGMLNRFVTGMSQLDIPLGGGLVAGSVILIGGDPGVGKSTLAIAACGAFAAEGRPVLYVTGHGIMRPVESDLNRLREWLDAGGFLWVDDNYGLDNSFRETMSRLYPDLELVALDGDHPIYSAYYNLPGLPKVHEHDGLPARGFALFDGGRMKVFYSFSSDIGDGLEDPAVHGDRAAVREAAMRMAINICYFALTQS